MKTNTATQEQYAEIEIKRPNGDIEYKKIEKYLGVDGLIVQSVFDKMVEATKNAGKGDILNQKAVKIEEEIEYIYEDYLAEYSNIKNELYESSTRQIERGTTYDTTKLDKELEEAKSNLVEFENANPLIVAKYKADEKQKEDKELEEAHRAVGNM